MESACIRRANYQPKSKNVTALWGASQVGHSREFIKMFTQEFSRRVEKRTSGGAFLANYHSQFFKTSLQDSDLYAVKYGGTLC